MKPDQENQVSFQPTTGQGQAWLETPPEHGVNLWVMSSARRCAMAGHTPAQAFNAIMAFSNQLRQGRTLTRQEVERAIATSHGTAYQAGASASKVKPMSARELSALCPPITEEKGQEFVKSSPLRGDLPTAEILSLLFRPEEFILLKTVKRYFPEAVQVRNLAARFSFAAHTGKPLQFVSSSPVTGRTEKTQDGRDSVGALECFTRQRYVVVEFDSATPQEQFTRILWLKERIKDHAPLVMMLRSGGKSFHAWFMPTCSEVADQLKAAAVKIGADPAALRIHQPVRCPNQIRDNGQLQQVLWLSAAPLTTPIP